MVKMKQSRHTGAGGYTLIELDGDASFGWQRNQHGNGPYRYILPDILVEDAGIEEIEEIHEMDLPLAGVLSLCPELDRVYAAECARHEARVALATNHYELPHDIWINESSALGAVEYAIWPDKGELRASHGKCAFRAGNSPEELRLAIRNALRNMTGQKTAKLDRPRSFCGPEMTSIAAWVTSRLRPYAAGIYDKWIERTLQSGYMDRRLVLLGHDVAGPCDRAELSYRHDRLTCTMDIGEVRFCEEVITSPAVTIKQIEERKGMPATLITNHPILSGRRITGVRHSDRRAIHTLDMIEGLPMTIKVAPLPFGAEESEDLIAGYLSRFESITSGARIALSRMEISERVSRLSKVADRLNSETPCQDLKTHDLRLVTDGKRLDCDGPIAPGVYWRKGAIRIEGLPAASCHSIIRSGPGKPLRDFVAMPGMEDAVINSVTLAPPGKRRPEQIVVRAA